MYVCICLCARPRLHVCLVCVEAFGFLVKLHVIFIASAKFKYLVVFFRTSAISLKLLKLKILRFVIFDHIYSLQHLTATITQFE